MLNTISYCEYSFCRPENNKDIWKIKGKCFIYFKINRYRSGVLGNKYCSGCALLSFNIKFKLFRICYDYRRFRLSHNIRIPYGAYLLNYTKRHTGNLWIMFAHNILLRGLCLNNACSIYFLQANLKKKKR